MLRTLCLGLLLVPMAARAEPVHVAYAAYAGGLNVMNMDATFDVGPSQYRARLDWHTSGAPCAVKRSRRPDQARHNSNFGNGGRDRD